MRTSKLFSVLFVAVALFSMVACDPTPDPQPVPEEKPCFTFEILSTSQTSVSFRVTPLATDLPYVLLITDKATCESFGSDSALIDDDLAWFEEAASAAGISLEEYLPSILITGVKEDSTEGLSPNTEYYLYAYHMNTYGEVVSDLEKVLFTTPAFDTTDDTFEVSVSDIGYDDAVINITPSSPTATYFVNLFTEERLAQFGEGQDAYKNHLVALRDYYLGMGATTEQIIANLCFAGTKSIYESNLKSGTKYYAYAIGVNDDFLPNTDAFVVEFETLTAETSNLTFEVAITETHYDHAEGTVTPSNDNETYICSIQLAESLNWYDSEQEFIESLLMEMDYWYGGVENSLRMGTTDLSTLTGLMPESDYVVVCFGYNQAATTKLFTFPFTTAAANGNPADLEVSFNIIAESLTHNGVNIEAIPSVGAYYFFSYISKAEYDALVEEQGSHDAALIEYANEEIDYGAEWFECTRAEYLESIGAVLGRYTMMFNQLSPATEYLAYAVAVDIKSGDIASSRASSSEVFKTLDKVVSDAKVEFEFGNYYDGTELANLDPNNFLNCKGYAVMPYTVTPTDSAMNWYTGFFDGDYNEWGCTDDDIYAELITYGYEWDSKYVSLNRESGIAILSYDTPFTFLGIAEDFDGNFGAGTLEVITLSRDGVSPAEELINSLTQPAAPQKVHNSSLAQKNHKSPIVRNNEKKELALTKKNSFHKEQAQSTKQYHKTQRFVVF